MPKRFPQSSPSKPPNMMAAELIIVPIPGMVFFLLVFSFLAIIPTKSSFVERVAKKHWGSSTKPNGTASLKVEIR